MSNISAKLSNDYEKKKLLDHLVSTISGENFLSTEGLGNEVPFFICPFKAEHQKEMNVLYSQLIKQLLLRDIEPLELRLYDIAMEILEERKVLPKILKQEQGIDKKELLEMLQNVLDPEKYLVPKIEKIVSNSSSKVVFLSGVGAVFPYLRSHNILNNLQSTIKHIPMIMFFPGNYQHEQATGASLDLFGALKDDNYYRAFNILAMGTYSND